MSPGVRLRTFIPSAWHDVTISSVSRDTALYVPVDVHELRHDHLVDEGVLLGHGGGVDDGLGLDARTVDEEGAVQDVDVVVQGAEDIALWMISLMMLRWELILVKMLCGKFRVASPHHSKRCMWRTAFFSEIHA